MRSEPSRPSRIDAAARIAGAWWAERLSDRYAQHRTAFGAAVTARVVQALCGEIAWKWEPYVFPSGATGAHTVRIVGDGKPLDRLKIEFDYDPDDLLGEALGEAIPELKSWDVSQTLPRKHELVILIEQGVIRPKEGYGNWTATLRIDADGA